MNKIMEDWEKEFDTKWLNERAFSTVIPAQGVNCGDANEIKSFIRELLGVSPTNTQNTTKHY